jgi:hypothetical protein
MRIELLYSPGCSNYKKALNTLEYIIAEERLPLPVELVENSANKEGEPTVRINGVLVKKATKSKTSCLEHVREAISHKWHEVNLSPLLSA